MTVRPFSLVTGAYERQKNEMTAPSRRFPMLAALIGAAFFCAPIAPALAEPETISKWELRHDDPDETHKRLRDLFWGMIVREDRRYERPPRRALSDVWFETELLPTRVPGLCRFDVLIMDFGIVEGDYDRPQSQARPTGFRARSNFAFHSLPTDDYSEIVRYDRPVQDECSEREKGDQFFSARNAKLATDGYRTLLALQAKLGSQDAPELNCNLHRNDTQSCEELLRTFNQGNLSFIQKCQNDGQLVCYQLNFGERQLQVYAPFGSSNDVTKAKLDSLIILSHQRID